MGLAVSQEPMLRARAMGFRGHPSKPFLAAALAALFLYRGMISMLGLDNAAIFTLSITAAALLALVWLTAHLIGQVRKE